MNTQTNSETKVCQSCKKSFVIDVQDFTFYAKVDVPPPTWCSLCRAQRRFAFRNERNLYKIKSAATGKDIFSMYSQESGYKVYEKDVWLSDAWDPMEYGVDIDFNKPFLEQVRDLWKNVPMKNLNVVNGVGSDYVNHFTNPKNCYLAFNCSDSENCMYSNGLTHTLDSVDVSHLGKSEQCYESFWLTSCAKTFFSAECESCVNMLFSKNCVGCSDCVGCVGLRNQKYHIWNESYSKEEYFKKLAELDWNSHQNLEKIKKQAHEFWLKFPNKYLVGSHNSDVSGSYISHSKNVKDSFLIREGEDLRYCQYMQEIPGSKDCYDFSIWGGNNQLDYECCACGIDTNRIKFCLYVQEGVHDIEYSVLCSSSANLFGCVGLRKKEYCILNKQYSREEYQALVPKIIQHMKDVPYQDTKGRVYSYGEFFPPEFSPWAYNETIAFDYFPLNAAEAAAMKFAWRKSAEKSFSITLKPENIPDRIKDTPDTILNEIIGCEHAGNCSQQCATAFKIIPAELQFYRDNNIPVPHLCPACRHYERLEQRSKLELYDRQCAKCGKDIRTAYSPNKPEIVYCESCYNAEVA
ncbi:MAG: hypothetical protein WC764_02245 [Candidatus Paceibacterota bacterium]